MAFVYNGNLYAVGVGDFVAFKGGEYRAMGKVLTESTFEVSSDTLDIRGGKRNPLRVRYNHSSEATFSIISATYNPDFWAASMGGEERSYANLPLEENLTMAGRVITLSQTPVTVGDIGAKVWVRYNGNMIGAIDASNGNKTITIPDNGGTAWAEIPNDANVCVLYNYKDINATAITIPADIQPEIWHIFIDVDVCTDKSGSGIVGRTVVEIPLGQLDPAQTFNATADGYSESKLTGIMLADTSSGTNACGGRGVYAYISTEIFNQKWYDSVRSLVNDPDDVTLAQGTTYVPHLLGIQNFDRYITLDKDFYGDLNFVFAAGTATGTTWDSGTYTIKAGTTAGTATLKVTCPSKPSIPEYTMEITVE